MRVISRSLAINGEVRGVSGGKRFASPSKKNEGKHVTETRQSVCRERACERTERGSVYRECVDYVFERVKRECVCRECVRGQ